MWNIGKWSENEVVQNINVENILVEFWKDQSIVLSVIMVKNHIELDLVWKVTTRSISNLCEILMWTS